MRMHELTVVVRYDELKALSVFLNERSDQSHLSCLCVDYERGALVATDADSIVRAICGPGTPGAPQCLAPAWVVQEVLRTMDRRGGLVCLAHTPGIGHGRALELAVLLAKQSMLERVEESIDAATINPVTVVKHQIADQPPSSYPDYMAVIARSEPKRFDADARVVSSVRLDTKRLANLRLVAKAAGTSHCEIELPTDDYDPVRAVPWRPEIRQYPVQWLALLAQAPPRSA